MSGARISRTLVAAAMLLAGAWFTAAPGEAHKAVTSKYHFNEDLFPLFRDHCGRCHVEGGVAPMSLMTYDDAAPWAESLRLELLSENATPWHPWRLTARELDMILVWASGGAPRGDAAKTPPSVPLVNSWNAGPPDATVKPPTFVLAAAKNDGVAENVLPVPSAIVDQVVGALDLLPGTPAIVRSATLRLKAGDGTVLDTVSWKPGQATSVPLTSAIRIRAGTTLVATVEYKRTWKYEGQEMRDDTTFGFYSAKAPVRPPTPRPGDAR
jgi:hypothetical protein